MQEHIHAPAYNEGRSQDHRHEPRWDEPSRDADGRAVKSLTQLTQEGSASIDTVKRFDAETD